MNKWLIPQILIIISFLSFSFRLTGQSVRIPDHKLWPRPVIIPLPERTSGVSVPVLSLDGIWKINMDPPSEFWLNSIDIADWKDIIVPSSAEKAGIRIQPDKLFAYKTKFKIPADFAGKKIIIRFEGVTGTAKAWVNGNFIKEHFGGFNIWNSDITQFVKPGEDASLTIAIIEESRRTSSGFNTGGIIRAVKLFAVPENYIFRFSVETDLDPSYRNAIMKVWMGANFEKQGKLTVSLLLKDPFNRKVKIEPGDITLTSEQKELIISVPVEDPVKWNAEHPELYTLEATIMENGKPVQTISKKVGFRKIEIRGVKMFVNGMEVKLRGGGRFDSDPVYGKYLSPEQSYKEVRMLKNANLNFVRPSCYPTTEDYFDACDSIGLYVQAENAVTFSRGSQNDTAYTDIYMNQMAEMVEADRSHPSIIIWELANETGYGINIGKTYQYARAEDPTRPVIYSWSQSVPSDVPCPYEIFSYHYPDWDQDLGKAGVAVFNSKAVRPLPVGMPVLHDEFGHGSAYYPVSLARDPGMRNFWGESIKLFWERMFTTEGCLGGSIWAVVDDNATGGWAYEWGMIDLWRRERPEYWLMKKAYSPVRIEDKPVQNPGSGKPLFIPVKNWNDHTDFNEMIIKWSVGSRSGSMAGPQIAPHKDGRIEIPPCEWKDGDILNLKFYSSYGMYVDEFNLAVSPSLPVFPSPQGPSPSVKEDNNFISVKGSDFEIVFSKSNGLVTQGIFKGKKVLEGGPYFNLVGGEPLNRWKFRSISSKITKSEVVINVSGTNAPVDITFEIRIDGKGLITTKYTLNKFGVVPPKATKVPWNNQDGGGFEEVGISWILTSSIDKLDWNRNGLWSVYPDNHIGRNKGTAIKHIDGEPWKFGTRPTRPWSLDELDFSVYGPYDVGGRGTNDFRSMKEYIYSASAVDSKSSLQVRAESDGTEAVRLEVLPDLEGWVDNKDTGIKYGGIWTPVKDSLGYFMEGELRSSKEGDYAEYTFEGTGICWIGTKGATSGGGDVYIDGKIEAESVSFSSRGKNRDPSPVIFSKQGLQSGKHTIKIVAGAGSRRNADRNSGASISSNAGIPFDAFRILNGLPAGGDVKMVINNLWNHTKMGLGNYMKEPVVVNEGYTNTVRIRLLDVN